MNTSKPTIRISQGIAALICNGRLYGETPQVFSLDRYNAVFNNLCTPIRTRFDADDNTFLFVEL